MTKHLRLFCLLLATLLFVPVAHAQQLLRILTADNATVTLAYLTETPTTWEGHTVTSATPYTPGYTYSSSDDEEYPLEEATNVVVHSSVANYHPTSLKGLFAGLSAAESISGLEHLNTSAVTDMSELFADCYALKSVDLSHLNTSAVTTMAEMFVNCSQLANLNLTTFDTQHVTDFSGMFQGCASLTQLDVSKFNTSEATTLERMFSDCTNLQFLLLNKFNTSKVTSLRELFANCTHLVQVAGIDRWNTSQVTDMSSLFSYCENLPLVSLRNWNTSQVVTMERMFYGCNKLIGVNIDNFNTSKVLTFNRMFAECQSLGALRLPKFDGQQIGQDTRIEQHAATAVFEHCNKLAFIDLSTATNFSDEWLEKFVASTHPATLKYLPQGTDLHGDNIINFDGSQYTTTGYVLYDEDNDVDTTYQGYIKVPYTFTADNATYLRTLKADQGPTTWYAPLKSTIPTGYEAYTLSNVNTEAGTATFAIVTTGVLEAQTPYLLIPTNTTAEGQHHAISTTTGFEIKDFNNITPVFKGDVFFTGVFDRLTSTKYSKVYTIQPNQQWQLVANVANFKDQRLRAYLEPSATATAPHHFDSTLDTPTAIHSITLQGGSADGRIYDLNGRYLGTQQDKLPKGTYIIKGKTVKL